MIDLAKRVVYFFWDVVTLRKGIKRTINDTDIKFPPRWSKYFQDDYEQENALFLKSVLKPGMTVIDIGAHLGLMAVIAGRQVAPGGKVYAFEPTPLTFSILQRVISLNGLSQQIIPVQQSVSNVDGPLTFFVDSNRGSNANSLVAKSNRMRSAVTTVSVTIDSFVEENKLTRVNFIKIDAEGSELAVLQGAQRVIREHRPYINLAIHPTLIANNDQSVREVYNAIDKSIYSIHYNGAVIGEEEFLSQADFFDVHLIPTV